MYHSDSDLFFFFLNFLARTRFFHLADARVERQKEEGSVAKSDRRVREDPGTLGHAAVLLGKLF